MESVTIMLATYNGEKYLEEQIESIINQTYKNWKLIISDDNSTDGTKEIINKYISLYPQKIKNITNFKEHSAKGNFINLFENVEKSDYYMFCDQDDIWIENKVEKFITRIKQEKDSGPILMYCDLKVVDENLSVLNESFLQYTNNYPPKENFEKFIFENHIPGCTMFYNNALKEKIGNISEGCRMHDWWIALNASAYGKIIFLDETLNLYRQHGNNTIGAKSKIGKKRIPSIIRKIKHIKMFNTSILRQLIEFKEKYEANGEKIEKTIINSIVFLKSKNVLKKYLFLKQNNYNFANKNNFYRYLLIAASKIK